LRAQFGAAGVERIRQLSNLEHEGELLEEIMYYLVQGEPLKKVAERNQQLLEFHASFAAREKRVWELDSPGLTLTYLKGVWYLGYRIFRRMVFQMKRALLKRH